MPPPLCFGDAREGTVGDLSSRARRGTTPLAIAQRRAHLIAIDPAFRLKGTSLRKFSSAQGMYIGFRPMLMKDYFVECGSSASSRRRSLSVEVRVI